MRLLTFLEMTKDQKYPNPMPHVSMDDPRMEEWYNRGEGIVERYMKANNIPFDGGKGWKKADAALGTVMDVPMDQIIGTETHLEPSGLERKAGDRFSSDMPVFYFVDGIYMVVDGNHRTVQAFLAGEKSIRGRVLDVEAHERQMAA